MNKLVIIIVVILVVFIGGYFLLRESYQAPPPAVTPTATKEEQTEQPAASAEIREITVIGTEFSFNPSSINVQSGEKIKVTFKNGGRAPHNLIIEGLGIGTKTIGGGQTDTIGFTAQASGTYSFFCSISGHRSAGMEGTLKVE